MEYDFTQEEFENALTTFVDGCTKISNDYREANYPTLGVVNISVSVGRKYNRIVRHDPYMHVHCFVDRTTGDVLKAADWKKPAKHARGNIFDEHNGLGRMGHYGPAYLR